jgi:hypothetical protein
MCQNQIELGQSSCCLLWHMCFLLGGVFHGLTKISEFIQKAMLKNITLEIYERAEETSCASVKPSGNFLWL